MVGDLLVVQYIGRMSVVAIEPAQVDVFATFGQLLRQAGGLMEGVMPTLPALADVGRAVARNRDIQNGELADLVRMVQRQGECNRPAPVMAGDEILAMAEGAVNQRPNVESHLALGIPVPGKRGQPEAAQIRRNDRIGWGQQRDDLSPGSPALGQPWSRTTAGPVPANA